MINLIRRKRLLSIMLLALAIGTVLFLAGCQTYPSTTTPTTRTTDEPASPSAMVNRPVEAGDEETIQVTPQGVKYIVHPDKIISGGPPKDGIPAIDNPKFVSVQEADEWIKDNELVLAIVYKGVARAYPAQIMVWHEIVNDNIAGDPVLITWCPLCGSAIAYERKVTLSSGEQAGERVETTFGTSGKLYNSNLVMYDRKTDTYWQQIGGKAIVGELAGQKLVPLPISTTTWREWKAAHPDSEVLSQDTGYSRAYGRDPYGNYYEDSYLFFPVEREDDRIHPKTVVYGIEVNGKFKAYQEEHIVTAGVIEDNVGDVLVRVEKAADGRIIITEAATGKELPAERDFWFAWYAFHPDTLLYEAR